MLIESRPTVVLPNKYGFIQNRGTINNIGGACLATKTIDNSLPNS